MKKILLTLSMICLSLGAFAQDEFFPGWYLQLQGGAGHTVGETSFTKLISPEAALSLGYQFTPAFSLRGNVAGWQGKGATITNTVDVYKFNYLQGALDAVFDLRNAFGGYKDRVFNPYFFIGAGANYAFNNGVDPAKLPVNNNYWADKSVSPVGRAGLGLDFKVSDGLSLGIECVENVLNDNFNSKEGDVVDHQINALVGLKYQFGAAKRRAAEAAALAAAEAAAAKAAADKAAAELAARQAAERAAAERAAAERAAAERAAAEKAAAEAARAKARQATENVYFVINKWEVRPSEQAKIDHIVSVMKQYPEAVVVITGYADKWTGTDAINQRLSDKRADEVAAKLMAAGISETRITSEYRGGVDDFGDRANAAANRVAVVIVK